MSTAFDYGEYEKFYADVRVKAAFKEIDVLAKKMKIGYAVIGGMAVFLLAKNPPQDIPDIDILLYESDIGLAEGFIKALSKRPGFYLDFLDIPETRDVCFSTLHFKQDIQIDILTSLDEQTPRKTRRKKGVEIEPVEPLIVEKLIRGNREDILMAIDLLAYADPAWGIVTQIAREYRTTGTLQKAAYYARRLAVGKLNRDELEKVVQGLMTNDEGGYGE